MTMQGATGKTILEIREMDCGYGPVEVLKGVGLVVGEGEIVALLGPNGAGKSTLMRGIIGLLSNTSGTIIFNGEDIGAVSTEKIVKLGITLVPEGRLLFAGMSVLDNLRLGTYYLDGKERKENIIEGITNAFNLFPALEKRKRQLAGTLSGGEQQMVAIARGLMGRPKLLMLDEPSLGVAPLLVRELMNVLARLRDEQGISILLAEQNAAASLKIADRGYVLRGGKVILEGTSQQLKSMEAVQSAYLGKEV